MAIKRIKQVYRGSNLVDVSENCALFIDSDTGKITIHPGKNYTELDNKYFDDCKIWDKIENKEISIDVSNIFS